MAVITDSASAEVKRGVNKLTGKVLTRPALLVSDGINLTYACDVEISEWDSTGKIKQIILEDDPDHDPEDTLITGIPGQRDPEDWQLDDSLPGHVDTTLHNVVIARNSSDLIYADIGNAVELERNESGNWHITKFAVELPGTRTLYPVDLDEMTIGTVIDMTIDTRLLSLAELGELKPFGNLPFGASAIFEGGELVRIV